MSLLGVTDPHPDESVAGFLIRSLRGTGSHIRDILELRNGHRRRVLNFGDAATFAVVTGVAQGWFEYRLPQPLQGDGWQELQLFGRRWRGDWTVRGSRQQICTRCIAEAGIARLEWDLTGYFACHVHACVLIDSCSACGRAISVDRPSLDVCSCGHFLDGPEHVASEIAVQWCQAISDTLASEAQTVSSTARLPSLLYGLSLDGAYRLLIACGGGSRVLQATLRHGDTPWLTSATVHALACRSLERLGQLGQGMDLRLSLEQDVADSLAEQQTRGVSAFDRASASRVLALTGLRSNRRTRRKGIHEQLQLF